MTTSVAINDDGDVVGSSQDDDEDIITCCECGNEIDDGDEHEYQGDIYCQDCVPSYTCAGCEEWFVGECYGDINGHELCRHCDGNYDVCNECGNFQHVDDMYYSDRRERYYCRECYFDRFVTCANCGHGVDINWDDYFEHDGDYYCSECYHETVMGVHVHDYGYKPYPIFHGDGAVHYGLELETDKYGDICEASRDLFDNAQDGHENDMYQKEDGSLDDGIELVFHPRTVTAWRKYEKSLDLISRVARRNGGRSFNTNTCGIHVHRSRKDLSELTLAKLVAFFATCQSEMTKVAQRDNSMYASFQNFSGVAGDGRVMTYKFIKDGEVNYERYQAINFQNHSTIEFRIFKGTLKTSTILNYISFCHYVVDFCKVSFLAPFYKESNTTWLRFVDYLKVRAIKEQNALALLDYLKAKKVA